MNRRRLWTLATLALLALAAGLLASRALGDPAAREIRLVQRRLLELAKAASFKESDSPFLKLGYPNRVTEYFAPETEFDLQLGNRSTHGTFTRSQLAEGTAALRGASRGLSIEFLDIAVHLGPTPTQAVAHLTSKIYFVGDPDYLVQEFRIGLTKSTNAWTVHRLETVRTMEP